jgi:hypothetical protein
MTLYEDLVAAGRADERELVTVERDDARRAWRCASRRG